MNRSNVYKVMGLRDEHIIMERYSSFVWFCCVFYGAKLQQESYSAEDAFESIHYTELESRMKCKLIGL